MGSRVEVGEGGSSCVSFLDVYAQSRSLTYQMPGTHPGLVTTQSYFQGEGQSRPSLGSLALNYEVF